MVDRYSSDCAELCHFPDDNGKWIYYDDYEALEAKLAAMVEESEATLDYIYNPFEPDNQSKRYYKLKAAIAAAKVTP